MKLVPALYDLLMSCMARRVDPLRRRVVSPTTGRVLEVGAGTGLNIPHYERGAVVIATDPDPAMLKRAIPRGATAAARVYAVVAAAEALPFRDGTFDAATATLVFCSVGAPRAAFTEVMRVLRPGGRLHFLEHVRSASRGWARFQDAMTPVCNVIAGGCCPNRPTVETMEAAGLAVESLERFALGVYPTRPMVLGSAVKPAPAPGGREDARTAP